MKTYFDEHGIERQFSGNTTSDRTETMEKPSTIDKAIEHLHLYNARFPRADIIEEALQQAKKDIDELQKKCNEEMNIACDLEDEVEKLRKDREDAKVEMEWIINSYEVIDGQYVIRKEILDEFLINQLSE